MVPIHKSKNRKLVSNFSPISVLSIESKILEKLMKTRANSFLKKHNVLYSKQFGVREGCSTSDAVLEFVDRCATAMDDKLFTVAILLDLSKAFDTVNKDIMLNKLNRLGFREIIGK